MSSKYRSFHTRIITWLCAFAVASAIACGGDAATETDKARIAQQTSGKADSKGAKKAPSEASEEQGAPQYPHDLPAFPNAKVVSVKNAKDGGGASYTLETSDTVSSAATQVSSVLEKGGWFVQSTVKEDSHYIFADKGSRNISVQVTSQNGVTVLNLLDLELQ